MKSKTLILSEQNSHSPNAGRGILTLSTDERLMRAKLRLYNIESLPKSAKLGVFYLGEVFSAPLVSALGCYESKIAHSFDISEDFYCAIIDTSHGNNVIISGGTYAGCYFDDSTVFQDTESQTFDQQDEIPSQINPSKENKNLNFNKQNEQFSTYRQTESEREDKCVHCKYKEYFYNQPNLTAVQPAENLTCSSLDESNEGKTEPEQKSILDSIIPQFEYIFENYPADETLNNLIENSRFVKIEASEPYSIGALYENDQIKYICYAVKKNYNEPAPEELGEYHQWLPLDPDDPLSEGYHMVFQDATDLKIIQT